MKNRRDNWEAIKVVAQTISSTATTDDIATALEDSDKLLAIAKGKEEKRKWDLEQFQKQEEEKK